MIIDESDFLAHYGILRKSGRYPWGSGGTQDERNRTFLGMVEDLRKQGLSETEIAKGLGIETTTQLRAAKTIAANQQKQAQISMAQRLKDKGYSNVAIGQRMDINESSVRALLAPGVKDKVDVLTATSGMLKKQVAKKAYLDVGSGVEHHLGVSRTKLNAAIAQLKEEGYGIHYVKIPQLGTSNFTTQTVLAGPGVKYSEVFKNRSNIKGITEFSNDGGRTFFGIHPPTSISSKKVAVRYGNEGGADLDGVIYVRRGKEELSLGKSSYAQVRIAVDGTHYIKGMAMYKDDMPDGVDLIVNVNKANTGNKFDALKKMKDDPDNPFGASISRQHGIMNIVNEEGSWDRWSRTLSSQMLSKQSPALAREQLRVVQERKREEFEQISRLTNPAVRRKLLESFADDADAASVHLKAAALPRTANHVILPINSLKDNEIYAPNYRDGERVVLVRHPHGGIFEIPELTVNNRNTEAKRSIGRATDAVGINQKVAQRLSGADFDGDTVLVIPNNNRKVKTASPLEGLRSFDPIRSYSPYDGMKTIDGGTYNATTRKVDYGGRRPRSQTKQVQMGEVTNLIADMTIRGANSAELARAVRHSMVVIDAEKHNLDYKRSAQENGISALKTKYQGGPRAGASTLVTRAGSEIRIADRKPRSAAKGGAVDKATGKKVFEETGETFTNNKGQLVKKIVKSKRLAEVDDANVLSSGTPIEKIYADHSNSLKALANQARLSAVNTKNTPYSPSAKTAYSREVVSLNAKLNLALRNSPLERQAQVLANEVVRQKTQAHPDMDTSELKRVKAQALAEARTRTGARKQRIEITDSEWTAIQAGAISTNMLNKILSNSDLDRVKELATPRSAVSMTSVKKSRAQSMIKAGYTQAEIADALGVSVSTLKVSLSE